MILSRASHHAIRLNFVIGHPGRRRPLPYTPTNIKNTSGSRANTKKPCTTRLLHHLLIFPLPARADRHSVPCARRHLRTGKTHCENVPPVLFRRCLPTRIRTTATELTTTKSSLMRILLATTVLLRLYAVLLLTTTVPLRPCAVRNDCPAGLSLSCRPPPQPQSTCTIHRHLRVAAG